MIELIQVPWSPFCLVQRRILEFAQVRFKRVNIPPGDRSLVWRLTRQRYYSVPVVKEGKTVVFEIDEDSQVIAKYLDSQLQLGLFPRAWSGLQNLLWRYFEHEIEGVGFKLNDIYYEEFVPPEGQLDYVRYKERKFGRGCLNQWRKDQPLLQSELALRLLPCEQMLAERPYLLGERPRFVDFDLYGMLGNFLFTGHYDLPAQHTQLRSWHQRMAQITRRTASPDKSGAKEPGTA